MLSQPFNDRVMSHWNKNELCKWGIIFKINKSNYEPFAVWQGNKIITCTNPGDTWSSVQTQLYQTQQHYFHLSPYIAPHNPPQLKVKDGLSLKTKILQIYLYFIATQNLWNYALVEDIDNWTQSYILIII